MTEDEQAVPNATTTQSRLPAGRNACLISATIVVVAICITFALVWLKTLKTVETISAGLQIPFFEANIQETFQNTAFEAAGNDGGILEIATATTTENFKRTSEVSLFDHILPLGTTVSEIQIPATYRYHIDLNAPWQVRSQQQQCVVIAPEIRASLPVAFDTGKMKSKTASGWARWNKHENLQTLERSLTDKLAKQAVAAENIDKIRDEARLSIAKFIQNWLLNHKHWNDNRFTEIIVIFPDELEKNAPLPPPTLRIEPPGKDVDAPTLTPPANSQL